MDMTNKNFAGPMYIQSKLRDLIQSAKYIEVTDKGDTVSLSKSESIDYIFIECIAYYKKNGMSFDDFYKKLQLQWTYIDTSFTLWIEPKFEKIINDLENENNDQTKNTY